MAGEPWAAHLEALAVRVGAKDEGSFHRPDQHDDVTSAHVHLLGLGHLEFLRELRRTLARGGPARLRRSRATTPRLRVLGLPAQRRVDARAPARVIVEEELLERSRLQLAVLGEL